MLQWYRQKRQQEQLRHRIANDPYYRFQSLEEVAIAAQLGIRIDVNQGGIDDWLRLPGLSIHQARILTALTGRGLQLLCVEDVAAALGLPAARLQPFEPILLFSYYDPRSVVAPEKLNPNGATQGELCQIPAIDAALAQTIIHQRQQQPFQDLADLQHRCHLSSDRLGEIMHYLRFS